MPTPYAAGILSRFLTRVAILAASLAWAGFVFVQTIGDPGRGEEIAFAVLDDGDARAEVVAPITRAVMSTAGLPPGQEPFVSNQIDLLLQDPAGARSFVDPFAGSWSRMLGEDDPRPAQFDLVPLLDRVAATMPDGTIDTTAIADRLPVGGVPLPRTSLDWLGAVRDAISVSLLPLTLVAAAAFVAAFLTGDRRRVLRRLGVWAVAAGLTWVVVPPVLVWAARRWASGADSVVAVALEEGTSGLLPVAIGLVVGGTVALATSFAVAPVAEPRRDPGRRSVAAATGRDAAVATAVMSPTRPVEPTAEIPITRVIERPAQRPADADAGSADPTVAMPTGRAAGGEPADDRDALWDYYGST